MQPFRAPRPVQDKSRLELGMGMIDKGIPGAKDKDKAQTQIHDSPNKTNKGECILTDCNVTGTDVGTPDKPKFALRPLWEHSLLPSLDELVAVGGPCAGAIVVHQEDNAGSDNSHSLTIFLTLTLC